MNKYWLTLWLGLVLPVSLMAQFWNGTDSVYGNEWIVHEQNYYKLKVGEDGMYKVSKTTMEVSGIPVAAIEAKYLQFWYMGQEQAVLTSTDGLMSDNDFISFYASKNRGEFDTHLYYNGLEDQFNPEYSLFTDTSALFITWDGQTLGKRIEARNNDLSNPPIEETHYTEVIEKVYNTRHFKYSADAQGYQRYSIYDAGQGFGIYEEQMQEVLRPDEISDTGDKGLLQIRVANNITTSRKRATVSVKLEGREIGTFTTQTKPEVADLKISLEENELDEEMNLIVEGAGSIDYFSMSLMRLFYPRKFKFNNSDRRQIAIEGSADPKYLVIEDFDGGSNLILYDRTNNFTMSSSPNADGHYEFVLPPSPFSRDLILYHPDQAVQDIDRLTKVDFVDYTTMDPEYVIISHPALYGDGMGVDPVMEYAAYRKSPEGGGYTTAVINVLDLYNQFAYGLDRHPASVRNFGQWFAEHWDNPKFALIIGKGVEAQDVRNDYNNSHFFVPCYGSPGADNLLISDNQYRPILPNGRIPAIEEVEILDYLEKVQSHERQIKSPQTIKDREWRKRVVHLSGGNLNTGEIALIRGELDKMADVISGGMYGAEVTTFQKQSSGSVVTSQSSELRRLVNEGSSIITYFGHSAIYLIAFQIVDNVEILQNKDRYHVLMPMGCYAGHIHHPNQRSFAEDWALAKQKGSIATIANSSAGFIGSLEKFGKKIYDGFTNEFFGKPIGLSVFKAVNELITENRDSSNNIGFTADTELAFSLHICGDPAIPLLIGPGPDFIVDPESVTLTDPLITTTTDSFELHYDLVNVGKRVDDSIFVRIDQELSNGEVITLETTKVPAPTSRTNYKRSLPNIGPDAIGLNKINIAVDEQNDVDEEFRPEAELNNDLKSLGKPFCFFIGSDDVLPVYPEDFSIVYSQPVKLIGSTSDSRAKSKSYLFEIDTTEEFNSPLKMTNTINQVGGVLEWEPSIPWEDERVYYWRISPDSSGLGQYSWRGRSFVYIDGNPPGWNQSHYYQFLKDRYRDIEIAEDSRRWKYIDEFQDLKIKNVVRDRRPQERAAIIRNIDVLWDYKEIRRSSHTTGVYVTYFDPQTVTAVENSSPGLYGSRNTSNAPMPVFAYDTRNYQDRVDLMNLLDNVVPDGYYVSFLTLRAGSSLFGAQDWLGDKDSIGTNLFEVLERQGAMRVRELINMGDVPYALFYKKNDPSYTVLEDIVPLDGLIELNPTLEGLWTEGDVTSTTIGPALSWETFLWDYDEEVAGIDRYFGQIWGVKNDGSEDLIFDQVTEAERSLTGIDAQTYPYLNLKFFSEDTIDRSVPQLQYWRVHYKSLPEIAVNPAEELTFYNDTIIQGEQLKLSYRVENIGQYDFDSVLVKYTITDAKNNSVVSLSREQALIQGGAANFEFTEETLELSGNYRLTVELNPDNDQAELYHFNNFLLIDFFVLGDNRNPLLDVTFDGLHILDGDLISAKPEIIIRLTDENTHLALDDTSLITAMLLYPNDNNPRLVSFNDPDVEFIPANSGNLGKRNEAKLVIRKKFEIDGIYELIVNGKDKSDNISGDLDYKISFEVINESSISDIVNYPNPFTSSTRFVYTLTGEQSPQFYKIQIMTVSGKVVRELTQDEIGPLRVGKHMTEYAWNGTDAFGDKLANGVYLYRLVARDTEGNEIKNRDVGISNYFKKGWGKMVLIR